MTKILKVNLLIFIALLCNFIVFYATHLNNSSLSDAHNSLSQGINKNVQLLTQLQKLERTIGYVGFIHHFKNFVLRQEAIYYQQANESYVDATILIHQIIANRHWQFYFK
ncbi:MAG: hypothetical protein HWE10_02440 [Gammaproteobacteria bacterium]|nr:hypothetical protein [Gammaproteobacteria bacterium]